VALFEINLEENIFSLYKELKSGSYEHGNYECFKIADPKERIVHKAQIKDRIVHQAVYRVLYSIFDKQFIYDSYSSRIGKGTHRAVKRLKHFTENISRHYSEPCFAVKMDVRKFFHSIDHCILKELIAKQIKCQKTLKLITQIIDSFFTDKNKGLPIGNVTSQLFANIYLDKLDRFIKHRLKVKYYIRFCDDFVVVKNNNDFNTISIAINDFIGKKLGLKIKEVKSRVRKISWGFDFLGFVVLPHHLVMRTKTKKRILRKVVEKNQLFQQGQISYTKYKSTINSYRGLLKHSNNYKLLQEIV